MGWGRCVWAVILGVLVQRCVLVHLSVWGVCPMVLPPLLCVLGMAAGEDRGAACGLLAGALTWLAGASPCFLALYPLAGGLAGKFFPLTEGFWKRWLCSLPILAGMELFLVGRSLFPGMAVLPALTLAGPECLLSAACFPLAAALGWIAGVGKKGRQGGRL